MMPSTAPACPPPATSSPTRPLFSSRLRNNSIRKVLTPPNCSLKLLVSSLPGKTDIEREALRNLIRLDPGDLVAQVAHTSIPWQRPPRPLTSATVSTTVPLIPMPSIRRSKAKWPCASRHIASERGDTDSARGFLKQALALNDVNLPALREMVRLSDKSPEDQLAAIVTLLNANPLQPEAWLGAAGILASGGAHDRAADYLVVALDQMQFAGRPASADVYLQLGIELACTSHRAQAYPILISVAKLPDAPISALVAARLLAQESPPPARSATSAPDAANPSPPALSAEELTAMIRKKLQGSIAADPKSPAVLAEAAWVELSTSSELSPETIQRISDYAALVPADDPTLARLQAWKLLRENKLPEAQAAFEKIAPADPLAQLGLARLFLLQNKQTDAAKCLQELWSAPPSGLLALQVAQTAYLAHVPLADPKAVRQLIQILAALPSSATVAQRNVRDIELVSATLSQRTYQQGEPILLNLRITNTAGHSAPVGPDGLIKTSLALTAATTGIGAQDIGVFAIEDIQRTYRLGRGDSLQATIRVDQGSLADRFQITPLATFNISLTMLTVPRINGKQINTGLGGQTLSIGDFDRTGAGITSTDAVTAMIHATPSMTLDKQMMQANMLIRLLDTFTQGRVVNDTPEVQASTKATHAAILGVLGDLLKSPSPPCPWMTRLLPSTDTNDEIETALAQTVTDRDPTVRMMWGTRQVILAGTDPAARKIASDALGKQADADPLLRQWFTTLSKDLASAPPAPDSH